MPNNLKQIGLACHNYESSHGRLPPGYLGPIPNERDYGPDVDMIQHVGLLVYLLPHIEQDALFRQLQLSLDLRSTGPAWFTNPTNWRLAQTRLAIFECPSNDLEALRRREPSSPTTFTTMPHRLSPTTTTILGLMFGFSIRKIRQSWAGLATMAAADSPAADRA